MGLVELVLQDPCSLGLPDFLPVADIYSDWFSKIFTEAVAGIPMRLYHNPEGPKYPKCGCVSILRMVIMDLGGYIVCGYWDPQGNARQRITQLKPRYPLLAFV